MDLGTNLIEPIPVRKTQMGVFRTKQGDLIQLHADSRHMQLYLLRGFQYIGGTDALPSDAELTKAKLEKLIQRNTEFKEAVEEFRCEICGEIRKDATSLGAHKRTHSKRRSIK